MHTSQTSILSEIQGHKPISKRTKAYYRRRLQNRFHRLILAAFREQQKRHGLNQKQLAQKIDKDKSKVNRWLGIPSNLTLETISDLLLGLGVDLDDPAVTPIANLVHEADQKTTNENGHFGMTLNSLNNETEHHPPLVQAALVALEKQQERLRDPKMSTLPEPASGGAISKIGEVIQQQCSLEPANRLTFAEYPKRKMGESHNVWV